MRKRKSPIFLVTTMGVVIAVAFGLQYVSSKTGGPGTEAPPAPPSDMKPVGEPRAAEAQSTVAGNIKTALGGGGGATEPPKERMGAPGMMMPTGPMIMKPAGAVTSGVPEKPKPNTSSTSSHWYDKDSMMGSQK